jgi:hypothetical protein
MMHYLVKIKIKINTLGPEGAKMRGGGLNGSILHHYASLSVVEPTVNKVSGQ